MNPNVFVLVAKKNLTMAKQADLMYWIDEADSGKKSVYNLCIAREVI